MVASGPVRRFAGVLAWAAGVGVLVTPLGPLRAQESLASPPSPPAATSGEAAQPPEPAARSVAAALDVAAGATCFEEGPLGTEVETWLGRDRLGADVQVHVIGDAHDAHAVVFRIVRQGKTRERRFDHLPANCEDATAVVALAIALAIDANAVPGLVAPREGGDEGGGEAVPPERVLAAQIATGYEVLPGGSLGLSAGVEYGLAGWFSLRADLLAQVSWSNSIEGVSGVFDAVVGAAAPQICAGGPVSPHFRLELCSGAAIGLVHVQGRGYAVLRSATRSWVVASGGIRLLFDAGILWAVDVGGVFPLHAPAIRAQDAQGTDQFRAPSAAGALLSIGPAFNF